MTDKRIDPLARWLNAICRNWPPTSYEWEGRRAEHRLRREIMRQLAREALFELDREAPSATRCQGLAGENI